MYNDKKILTLDEFNIIHNRLSSFITDKMSKFYRPVLRKMFAEVFSKSAIRYINNNKHKYNVLLYSDRGIYNDAFIYIDYCRKDGKLENIIIKKDDIKDLLPKNITLNINYIRLDVDTVKSKNLRKYYDALNMLYFSMNVDRLNIFHLHGWGNPSINDYYRKSIGYLKKHNILMYNILMNKPCNNGFFQRFDASKESIMDIYKYYDAHFYGYIGKRISFLRYIKAYKPYIIKMLCNMKYGESYEKSYKK